MPMSFASVACSRGIEPRCRAPIAASVFDHAAEGIVVTDAHSRIVDVNASFSAITGYARDEVLGRRPSLLSSGRHGPDFYRAMWRSLRESGQWKGEVWNRRRDGQVYAELLHIVAVTGDRGRVTHYVGIFSDVTAQKHDQEAMQRLTHYDALTGLPNRVLMLDRLTMLLSQAERHHTQVAVCSLDLDSFKDINDRWGHEAGDELLLHAAERMRSTLRAGDTVARLGGDEFVLLLGDAHSLAEVQAILDRVLEALAEPYTLSPGSAVVTTSIGVALYPAHGRIAEHLLRDADHAMYRAKRLGKNRACFVDAIDAAAESTARHREGVRAALHGGQLCLHFQPKVAAYGGRPCGAEALVRWEHPQHGLVAPGEFLPAIEGTPLAVELDLWVLERALERLARWQQMGLDLALSVNVTAQTMTRPDLVEQIGRCIERSGARARDRLELEVVETAALKDIRGAVQAMHACAELGVRFSLDDFGTGYSSLAYLRQLPVQTLKIDQSFVGRMLDDRNDMHIVKAVIGLARAFGVTTVAEGVETDAQAEALAELGCDQLQGYGIAHPMSAEAFAVWVESRAAVAALGRPDDR